MANPARSSGATKIPPACASTTLAAGGRSLGPPVKAPLTVTKKIGLLKNILDKHIMDHKENRRLKSQASGQGRSRDQVIRREGRSTILKTGASRPPAYLLYMTVAALADRSQALKDTKDCESE